MPGWYSFGLGPRRGVAKSTTRRHPLPVSPSALEARYARLIETARRAEVWSAAQKRALAAGDRETAAACLTRHWAAVRLARGVLAEAWPGIEVRARRELAARWPHATPDEVDATLATLHRTFRDHPPAPAGLPGLYGRIRRAVTGALRAHRSDGPHPSVPGAP